MSLERTESSDTTNDIASQSDTASATNTSTYNCVKQSDRIAQGDVESSDVTLPEQQIAIEEPENLTLENIGPGAVGGSEETFDTICQACLEDEKHVEAFMYCVECEEYLCQQCVTMHRGVRLTRGHKLVSKQVLNENGSTIRIERKESCHLHSGEYLEWFCKTDSSLGCNICKSIIHGKCKDVTALSEAVNSLLTVQKVDEIVKKLESTKASIRSVVCKGQRKRENLVKDKSESLKKLENIKTDIEKKVKSLNNLMQKDETKIEETYVKIDQVIENDIEKFITIENALDKSISTLKNERWNDEYRFVHVMKAQDNLKTIAETLKDFETLKSFPGIAYERDKALDNKLESIDNLGYIDQEKRVYTVTRQKEIIVAKETENGCDIMALCVVDSRRLLLADWSNSSLKLVNTTEERVTSVKVAQRPFDICRVGEEERFAVTLLHGREIKLFSICEYLMSNQHSIKVGEKCRGLAYHDSKLFVACGGCGTDNEGPGHVRVYTLDGKLQNTVIKDGLNGTMINRPFRLEIQPSTNMVFLTDDSKILTMNVNNFEIDTVIDNASKVGSITFDASGRIIFSNDKTGSVNLLSTDYKRSVMLMKPTESKQRARFVLYQAASSTLFVGLEDSKTLSCYYMEINQWDQAPSF